MVHCARATFDWVYIFLLNFANCTTASSENSEIIIDWKLKLRSNEMAMSPPTKFCNLVGQVFGHVRFYFFACIFFLYYICRDIVDAVRDWRILFLIVLLTNNGRVSWISLRLGAWLNNILLIDELRDCFLNWILHVCFHCTISTSSNWYWSLAQIFHKSFLDWKKMYLLRLLIYLSSKFFCNCFNISFFVSFFKVYSSELGLLWFFSAAK